MEKLFKIPRYYVVEKAFWFYFSYSFKLCEWILKNFTVLWLKISTVLCLETLWNWVWLFSVVKKFFLFESSRFSIEFQLFWWLCNTEGALLEWKSSLKCIEAWFDCAFCQPLATEFRCFCWSNCQNRILCQNLRPPEKRHHLWTKPIESQAQKVSFFVVFANFVSTKNKFERKRKTFNKFPAENEHQRLRLHKIYINYNL